MNKIDLVICVFAAVLLTISVAAAMEIPANENAIENSAAPENSPVIELAKDGWLVERVDFIHYANGVTKPAKPSKEPVCYKLMGVKWLDTPVNYVINPNYPGMNDNDITTAISASAETWDAVTEATNLFGSYAVDNSAQFLTKTDGKNALVFGDYPNDGVIAVARVWYTRVGKTKKIVEFDIEFDTDFTWGDATVDPSKMDLQNIATHELGHAIGLSDIYTTACSEVTMYGYSSEGDTEKRSLEQPDITGLQKLYGI